MRENYYNNTSLALECEKIEHCEWKAENQILKMCSCVTDPQCRCISILVPGKGLSAAVMIIVEQRKQGAQKARGGRG